MSQATQVEPKVKPHCSFSQLTSYLRCPKAYCFFFSAAATTETVSVNLVIGSIVHTACELFNLARLNDEALPTAEEMIALAEQSYMAETKQVVDCHGELVDKATIMEKVTGMIGVYRDETDQSREVVAVEEEFTVTSQRGYPKLIGRIDLIERTKEGKVVVIDLKTAASRSRNDPRNAWQIAIYAHHAKQEYKADVHGELHVILKTKKPAFDMEPVIVDKKSIKLAYANVSACVKSIRASDRDNNWPCAFGRNCNGCEWRRYCQ